MLSASVCCFSLEAVIWGSIISFRSDTFFDRSNKALAASLDKATDPLDPIVNKLLRSMATHAMSNALYFSTGSCPEEEFHHYGILSLHAVGVVISVGREAPDGLTPLPFVFVGLALEKYTHFTSPIRRYADIVVHRLLVAATLNETKGRVKDYVLSNKDLEELCRHINNRNRVRYSLFVCICLDAAGKSTMEIKAKPAGCNIYFGGFLFSFCGGACRQPSMLRNSLPSSSSACTSRTRPQKRMSAV